MSWNPFRRLVKSRPASMPRKGRPLFPRVHLDCEPLEIRMMPTVVSLQYSTYSIGETGWYQPIQVDLDAASNDTITVQYATSNGTATAGSDYTSTSGTLTFVPQDTSETFSVWITDDDSTGESDETVTLTLSNPTNATLGSPSTATLTITNNTLPTTALVGQYRQSDFVQADFVPYGPVVLSPQTGDLRSYHTIDFRKSVGSPLDAWSEVGVPPALLYRSETVSVKPIVDVTFSSAGMGTTLTQFVVTLTWNNGSPQSPVTHTVSGAGTSDVYVLAGQVSSAVTSTGRYPWSLRVVASFSDHGDYDRTYSGNADVIVNGSSDPFGHGWTLAGLDYLIPVGSNLLWVSGSGGTRYFNQAMFPGQPYQNPANEFGALVKNGDNTYTYTATNQVKWYFGTDGKVTKIVDPHSLTRTFTYASGRLSKVEEPDGGVTTFTYDGSNLLATIQQPGGRTLTFTHDGNSDLTGITNPDGGLRTFTYDSSHRLTNDKWGPLNATFTYDSNNGTASSVNLGLSSTLSLTALAAQGLATNPAKKTTQAKAILTDALSQVTTLTLDTLGRFTERKTPDGATVSVGRNSAGQVVQFTGEIIPSSSWTYSGADMTAYSFPESGSHAFTYHSTFHKVTEFTDSRSNKTTFTYDATTGDLLTVKDALTNVTTLTWSSGLLQTATDALNHTTTLVWEGGGTRRLQAVIDANGGRTTFTYDSAGNTSTVQDALASTTTTVYDGMRRLTSATNAAGGITTFTYNAIGDVTSAWNVHNVRTDATYDQRGLLTTVVEAVGQSVTATSTITYDVLGRVSTQVDPNGNTLTFTYDAVGHLKTRVSPVVGTETFTYDLAGRMTNYTDQRGNVTTFTLDGRSRQTAVKDALNNLTTTVYDAEDNITAIVDARGNRSTFTYDALNRLTEAKDALSNVNTVVYDAVGNILRTIDALGNRVTFTYDVLNRQVTMLNPAGGTFTTAYDAVGNVVNVIDQLGNKTTFVYDALNRRTKTIDALNGTTTLVYDPIGNVVNVVDPVGNTTTFVYDLRDRLLQEFDPLAAGITYAYDAGSRLTSRTDRLGRRRDFTYDNFDRLTGEKWVAVGGATDNLLTFTYDATSNLLTARDYDGAYTFTYDAVNQPLTQKDLWNLTLTFTYDAVGNRTKLEDSLSGVTTSTYSAVNLLTKREFGGSGQTPLRIDLTYTARLEQETLTRYSDLAGTTKIGSTTFMYDTTGRQTRLEHRDGAGSLLANYTYTYDTASRLTTEVLNGTTVTYTYDNTHQLTGDGVATFTYDANGNRTNSGYTTATGNRLTNDGTWTYTYDAEGNLTQKSKGASLETWTYGYDQWNHMTWAEKRATVGGTLQMRADYKYDVFGNRVEKVVDADGAGEGASVTARFAYDGDEIWADLDGSSSLTMRYLRGDGTDELFARISAGGTAAWYLTDRMGSVRDIVNASGSVIDHIDYDGFGSVTNETQAGNGDRWKWTGREGDSETGLYYTGEYYDPKLGRRTSEHFAGFGSSDPNLYRYRENNPSSYGMMMSAYIGPDDILGNPMFGQPKPFAPLGPEKPPRPTWDPHDPNWPIPKPRPTKPPKLPRPPKAPPGIEPDEPIIVPRPKGGGAKRGGLGRGSWLLYFAELLPEPTHPYPGSYPPGLLPSGPANDWLHNQLRGMTGHPQLPAPPAPGPNDPVPGSFKTWREWLDGFGPIFKPPPPGAGNPVTGANGDPFGDPYGGPLGSY